MGNIPFSELAWLLFFLGLWCNALYWGAQEERGFFVPLKRLATALPWYIGYPLALCVSCMSSLHGLLFTAAYFFLSGYPIVLFLPVWIVIAVCGSFLNGFIFLVYKAMWWDNLNNTKKNGLFGDLDEREDLPAGDN